MADATLKADTANSNVIPFYRRNAEEVTDRALWERGIEAGSASISMNHYRWPHPQGWQFEFYKEYTMAKVVIARRTLIYFENKYNGIWQGTVQKFYDEYHSAVISCVDRCMEIPVKCQSELEAKKEILSLALANKKKIAEWKQRIAFDVAHLKQTRGEAI